LRLNDVADVVGIYPCPNLATSPGQLVTASYITDRANVIDLGFEDLAERIGTTAEHPFWSVTRQKFVDAGKVQIGEEVLALSGRTTRLSDTTPRSRSGNRLQFRVACYPKAQHRLNLLSSLRRQSTTTSVPQIGPVLALAITRESCPMKRDSGYVAERTQCLRAVTVHYLNQIKL